MNVKFTKRILSGALAVALVMAPSVGAFAKSTTSATAPTTTQEAAPANPFKDVQTTSSVAGVKSEVPGAYLLQKGVAVAITSSAAAIAEGYAFAKGEKPYAIVFDMDVKKSVNAKASLDFAAQAYGGSNVAYIDMELGKMSADGKYTVLPDGAGIAATFSIPKNALDVNAKYAVVRVVVGGAFTLLEDTDSNPETISFVTKGGAGAYSIVKY